MNSFAFHPELFEHRSLALETLAAHDFNWLEHFSSVDLLHDLFGLEVCAISSKHDAEHIHSILADLFSEWGYSDVYYHSDGADLGWKTIIHRDPHKRRGYRTV